LRISERTRPATALTYVQRVNRAIDHVVGHLGEPLRLRELSRVALLSPFHFHRVFQALLGETPADFVQRLRLEKALGMLVHARPASLTTLALECGFASSSDFSRSFKRRFGVPPSAFDVGAWRRTHGAELEALVARATQRSHVERLPPRHNPDGFRVRIRELPARTVAYIRVDRPYQGGRARQAALRLLAWAEHHGLADGQWLGYQWDNPEITALQECRYYVAVEAEQFSARGEVGRYRFLPMTVAEVVLRGGLDLELRALQWLYGSWLPRSGFVPDDQPAFEAWIGRPFAHGTEYFELVAQLPIRRGVTT
jgi:AraC family transcriptional regulator